MNRIKKARNMRGLTQLQVAKLMHVGRTTVTMWETSSQKPDSDSLRHLSNILHVPIDYLIGSGVFENWEEILQNSESVYNALSDLIPSDYEDPIDDNKFLIANLYSWFFTSFDESKLIRWFSRAVESVTFDENDVGNPKISLSALFASSIAASKHQNGVMAASEMADNIRSAQYAAIRNNESEQPKVETIRIPVFGSVPAGIPMEAIEDIIDWEELPAALAVGGKEYFAVQVKGDSMYPDYLDGDTVIVRKQPNCNSGDVCVVYVNGYDATLKTVKLNEAEGELTLVPKNPNYPPRTYSRQETADLPVSIAGVVVELRRKIK